MKTTLQWFFILFFAFSAQRTLAQIPNSDFENWSSTAGPILAEWQTNSCPACVPPDETYIVQQDSVDVYHGKYAAKFVYNGVYPAWATTGFALSTHPISLIAYVKNQLSGIDTAFIGIKLFKNGLVVDSGEWIDTTSILDYTQLTVPVSQNSTEVDSAEIRIAFGDVQNTTFSSEPFFWVDYLSLDFTNGIGTPDENQNDLIIFPNPANKIITIFPAGKGKMIDLEIFNSLGKEVFHKQNYASTNTLDISQFAEGIYYVRAMTGKQYVYNKKIIIKK